MTPSSTGITVHDTGDVDSIQGEKPAPTFSDIAYGPHERNVLDFWKAESRQPTPLVIFIHGGAFTKGDKSIVSFESLDRLLPAGISVASINYRFIQHRRLPAAHHDAARALQFLRSRAAEWNIDKTRIGAFGGSAGAQICMWLAFSPDRADPAADDPVARESTRLSCVAPLSGQSTLDPDLWMKWIPGFERSAMSWNKLTDRFDADTEEEARAVMESLAGIRIASADAPPVYMGYGQNPADPVPDDPGRARAWKAHHVNFGVMLKARLDELGVENYLRYPGSPTPYPKSMDFFIEKLGNRGAAA